MSSSACAGNKASGVIEIENDECGSGESGQSGQHERQSGSERESESEEKPVHTEEKGE